MSPTSNLIESIQYLYDSDLQESEARQVEQNLIGFIELLTEIYVENRKEDINSEWLTL